MLVIRQAQFDVFQNQPRLSFEREIAAYLKRYFPLEAACADLDRWISTGLDRAAEYGFLAYDESAQFLGLMAMLGSGFDEDPQIPWVAAMISSQNGTPMDRITDVYDKAIEYLDAIGGPNGFRFVRATRRLKKQDMTVLNRLHPRAVPDKIQELLTRIYPEKERAIGERALKQLVRSAIQRTEVDGKKSAQSALIHAVHMYYFGSDFHKDPCYPWAGEILSNGSASVDDRYVRLHQSCLEYLDRSLQFAA
jgi:hypothetical protein